MIRLIFLLSLSLAINAVAQGQIINSHKFSPTLNQEQQDYVESLLKLTETNDYNAEPQREYALKIIKEFNEEADSPEFSPLQFEIKASRLADEQIEQYQFIAAGLILRYAYQILLPYYTTTDASDFNMHYLSTSMAEFYLLGEVYYKAASWIDIITKFCIKTGRDNGEMWIRNLFNAICLFVKFNQIELASNLFDETLQHFLNTDKNEVSPYTVNAMLRATLALIDYMDSETFKPLLDYLNSTDNLSLTNQAYAILCRSKILTHYFGNHKDAFKMYKRLIDSPMYYIGFQVALDDIMEAAWHTDKEEYFSLSIMAIHTGRELIQLTLNSFSFNDSELFWHEAAEKLNNGFGINLNANQCDQVAMQGIFLNAVFTKALSVLGQREIINLIKEKGSDTYKSLLNDILALRHKMANTTDKELRSKYDGELENLESALLTSMDLSWVAGQQNNDAMFMPRLLKEGECEVEIVEYPCVNDSILSNHYGAIVCTSYPYTDKQLEATFPMEYYEFVPLGPVLAWELLYNGLGNNRTDRERANQYRKDEILSVANLFSPLLKHFREKNLTKAFISPTGILNTINIGALPWGSGDSIVNDRVEIIRINAAYDIKDIIKRDAHLNSAIVFSNIDFNKANDIEDIKKDIFSEIPIELEGYRIKIEKGNNMKKFPSLPINDKKLVELIQMGTPSIRHYSNANATEDVFKAINGNAPELLHIDTHGFYIPEGDQDYIGKHVIRGTRESALLTCGLALSGANKAWSGEDVDPGSEDGILTAWEISCMDLSGCKLAVLSACETAQGLLDNINGIIGLQRALKLAGVQAMLLTLWPVDNELTEEFINDFYRRLPHSANFNEAFLATQQEFRKRHTDPYHWAPFILIN